MNLFQLGAHTKATKLSTVTYLHLLPCKHHKDGKEDQQPLFFGNYNHYNTILFIFLNTFSDSVFTVFMRKFGVDASFSKETEGSTHSVFQNY